MASLDTWKFVFTWHIDNFNMLRIRMDSPVFVVDRLNYTKWFLRLEGFPTLDCFFLRSAYDADTDPIVDITLGALLEILDSTSHVKGISKVEYRTIKSNKHIRFPHSNFENVLHGWRSNDMTLRCTVWGDREPTTPSEQQDSAEDRPYSSRPLTQEYYSVVDDGTFLSTVCRPIRCSARTRIEVFRHSFPWLIEDIDLKDPNRVSSIRVESALRDIGSLSLSFHYQLQTEVPRFWVEVRRTVPDYKKKTFVKCYLTFVENKSDHFPPNVRQEYLFQGKADETWVLEFSEDDNVKVGEESYWYKNLKQRNGNLEMQVEMTLSHEGCHHHIQNSPAIKCDHLKDLILQRNIQRMQRQNSDVTLLPWEGRVKAHKSILRSHSDVIEATIRYAEEERKDNGVKELIIENDLEGFENTVKFMYGHSLELTPQNASQVLETANVYNVPTLLEQCWLYLKSNVTPETAPRLLHLSDLLEKQVIFDLVKSFIARRAPEILHSQEWEDLIGENPSLLLKVANEILQE